MPQRPPRFQPLHWRPKSEQIRQWAKFYEVFHPRENARQRGYDGQWEELCRLWLAEHPLPALRCRGPGDGRGYRRPHRSDLGSSRSPARSVKHPVPMSIAGTGGQRGVINCRQWKETTMAKMSEEFGSTYLTTGDVGPIGTELEVAVHEAVDEEVSGAEKTVVYLASNGKRLKPYIMNTVNGCILGAERD